MSRFISALGALCAVAWTMSAGAAGLVDAVQLVSSTAAWANVAPPAQTFTVTQAGSYIVTLTDLQGPAALASLDLAIANSTNILVSMHAAGTQTVTLPAGTYTAQVLAIAVPSPDPKTIPAGGTFSVQVSPAGGGAVLWQYGDTVGPPPATTTAGQSTVSTLSTSSAQFTVTAAGTYQLSATDLQFPVALMSMSVGVFVHCGNIPPPTCMPTPVYTTTAGSAPPFSSSLALAAGTYDLFIVANADPTATQGLYSIQVSGGGNTLYAATQGVGTLPAPSSITVGNAGPVSLQLTDLMTPAALSSIKAIVTENGSVLTQVSSAGATTFTATAGTAQLYVAAQPAGSGQGAYEAYLTSSSQVLADIAQPVLATGSFGYAFSTNLTSAGAYQVSVNDFQKPTPLTTLLAITTQQGKPPLGNTQTSPTFNAVAGQLNILVFPTLPSSTSEGLFGVTIAAPGSSAPAFQATQGVGALFSSQTVTVTNAGIYDLNLSDFALPESFSNLALIATNGNTVVGSIFNAGQLQLNLTAGTYVLSILAQVGPSANYGLYGLDLSPAPPAPTVTLTTSTSSVLSGQSATLTWSSTNATTCTASGSWSGTLATSGSQSTGALTQNGSFTLTCTGGGGTGTATAQVAVTTAAAGGGKSGGGGAIGSALLLVLAVVLLWESRRRCSEQATGEPQA